MFGLASSESGGIMEKVQLWGSGIGDGTSRVLHPPEITEESSQPGAGGLRIRVNWVVSGSEWTGVTGFQQGLENIISHLPNVLGRFRDICRLIISPPWSQSYSVLIQGNAIIFVELLLRTTTQLWSYLYPRPMAVAHFQDQINRSIWPEVGKLKRMHSSSSSLFVVTWWLYHRTPRRQFLLSEEPFSSSSFEWRKCKL